MNVTIDASDVSRFVVTARADSAAAERRVAETVRHYGQLLHTRVQANASGRPGPWAVTGDYRRTITMSFFVAAGIAEAEVGSAHPAARRLEKGFVGVDSRGRHYPSQIRRVTRPTDRFLVAPAVAGAQAELGYPYPHHVPALDSLKEGFGLAVLAAAAA